MITGLIVAIALEFGIPPGFMLAIATVENPAFDVDAVNHNRNGTKDLGIMQLNDSWYNGDPQNLEHHLKVAAAHLSQLQRRYALNWWQTAIAYNCGISPVLQGAPPNSSIEYANKVFRIWKGE